jgi:uncharacterized membrane protein YcaP (DUF421 family)
VSGFAPTGSHPIMWFDTWPQLLRIAAAACSAYGLLVVLLRTSGKRTLSKLNAFDFVVTVALGSTLASIALSSEVAVVEGFIALATLIGLQLLVAWLVARSPRLRRAVKSEPIAVMLDGELQVDRIRRQRLSPEEVRQAIRGSGVGGMELVAAVILETDGTLSVVTHDQRGSGSAMVDAADVSAPSRER